MNKENVRLHVCAPPHSTAQPQQSRGLSASEPQVSGTFCTASGSGSGEQRTAEAGRRFSVQTGRRPHFPGVEKGAGDGLLPHGSVPPRTSELGVPAEHQEPCGARTAAGSSLLRSARPRRQTLGGATLRRPARRSLCAVPGRAPYRGAGCSRAEPRRPPRLRGP